MYEIKKITAWKALCTGFSHSLVLYQKSHSRPFAALTRSISDTSPTRVKIPYARAFHEVISICYISLFLMTGLPIRLPADDLSVAAHVPRCKLQRMNTNQETAVKRSLRGQFTLIQGPPGKFS